MPVYIIYMIKTIFNHTFFQLSNKAFLPKVSALKIEKGLFNNNNFGFCQGIPEQKVENVQNEETQLVDRAANFYRNSIRRVNVNDKGKGKFTQHHLIRLMKLTDRVEQEPLLYEAYYNYLGHSTVIDSLTVDKMLEKAMNFQGCSLERIVEIYSNHNYLAYFPHYKITIKLLELVKKDEKLYTNLLNILINSPLIKFDAEIVNFLISQIKNEATTQTNYSLIIKLLTFRESYNLLTGLITRQQLLNHFTQIFQMKINNRTYKPIRRSPYIKHWIYEAHKSITVSDELHFGLAITGLSASDGQIFGNHLIMIKDQQKIIKALLFLEQTPQKFRIKTAQYIKSLEISQDLSSRLSEFAQSTIDPIQVQSE